MRRLGERVPSIQGLTDAHKPQWTDAKDCRVKVDDRRYMCVNHFDCVIGYTCMCVCFRRTAYWAGVVIIGQVKHPEVERSPQVCINPYVVRGDNRKNGGRSRRYRSVLKGMRCPPSSSDHDQSPLVVPLFTSSVDPNDEPVRLSAVRRGWLRLAMESAAQSSSVL